MARTMGKDSNLYRAVVTHHRLFGDVTYYYGPYTTAGQAKAQAARESQHPWNRMETFGHVEILAASRDPFGFPKLLWGRLDD